MKNNVLRITLIVLCLAVFLPALYAQDASISPMSTGPKKLKLKGTYIISATPNSAIGAGMNLFDSETISCPGTSTCTYEIKPTVVLTGGGAANTAWGLRTYMDGGLNPITGSNWVGTMGTSEVISGAAVHTKTGLTPGSHSIDLYVNVQNAATLNEYTIVINVYNP